MAIEDSRNSAAAVSRVEARAASAYNHGMKFPVSVEARGGEYVATSVGDPRCTVKGRSRDEALEKLRKEIRYRIEHCPCTGVADDFVEIVVI